MKTKLLVGVLVVVVTLGVAGGAAFAADSQAKQDQGSFEALSAAPARMRALGKVVKVHGKTLEVKNRRGTFDVLTDDETVFRVLGNGDPSSKDIEAGDLVAGRVVKQEDGTFLAKVIAVVPPPSERWRGLGRVIEVQGNTLVVENRRGTFDVLTDDETVFHVPGVEDPGIEDIEEGDPIAGKGIRQEDGVFLATAVAVVPPRRIARSLGRVIEIHGNKLVVETRRGTFDVHTDKDTVFRVPGVEEPTIKHIHKGEIIAGHVVKQDGNRLLAKTIVVVRPVPDHDL
jgi:RNase P/RNase MRP subunit p29